MDRQEEQKEPKYLVKHTGPNRRQMRESSRLNNKKGDINRKSTHRMKSNMGMRSN